MKKSLFKVFAGFGVAFFKKHPNASPTRPQRVPNASPNAFPNVPSP